VLLLPLGTNGFLPTGGRGTMSFLVARESDVVLLDAGTGLGRLLEPDLSARLVGLERLDIVLSHYHLDHVVGLSYLPGVARRLPVRIFAPAPPLTEFGPEALERLISPPLFPVGFDEWPMAVEVVAYSGPELVAGSFRFATRPQRHPGGSVGLRLGDELAYVTDTLADPETAEFARGVGTLLHEVWVTDEEAARDPASVTGHSAVGDVARLAREAAPGRLVPVHHRPGRGDDELAAIAEELRRLSGLSVRLPVEGEPIELGP